MPARPPAADWGLLARPAQPAPIAWTLAAAARRRLLAAARARVGGLARRFASARRDRGGERGAS